MTTSLHHRAGVFDITRLLDHFGGSPDTRAELRELVMQMNEQIPGDLRKARAAWSGGDRTQAAALIHGARGAVVIFGATRVMDALLCLERLLADAADDTIGAAFARADEEVALTIAAASAWLAQDGPGQIA